MLSDKKHRGGSQDVSFFLKDVSTSIDKIKSFQQFRTGRSVSRNRSHDAIYQLGKEESKYRLGPSPLMTKLSRRQLKPNRKPRSPCETSKVNLSVNGESYTALPKGAFFPPQTTRVQIEKYPGKLKCADKENQNPIKLAGGVKIQRIKT